MRSVDIDESHLPSAGVVVRWGVRRFLDIIILLCFFGGGQRATSIIGLSSVKMCSQDSVPIVNPGGSTNVVTVLCRSYVDQFFSCHEKFIRDVEILKHLNMIVSPVVVLGDNGFYPHFLEFLIQFGRKPFHDVFHTPQWVVAKLEVRHTAGYRQV